MLYPVLAFDIAALFYVPLAFLGLVLCIPILAILTYHKRKMLEIRLAGIQKGDQAMIERIEAVRQEVAQLRDTATQYDLSFDTALRRIESRVNALEARVSAIDQQPNTRIGAGG
jgi:hypothetical protein